jgi:hypothetical protein
MEFSSVWEKGPERGGSGADIDLHIRAGQTYVAAPDHPSKITSV